MGRNAHKKFYSKTYDHSYELVVKKGVKNELIKEMLDLRKKHKKNKANILKSDTW